MNALPSRTDTVIVPPVKDTSTTGGGGNTKVNTKVIGVAGIGIIFKQDAGGNYTVSSISFSDLSTGSDAEFKAGSGATISYAVNGGALSTEELYSSTFIVPSNRLKKNPTEITANDTLQTVNGTLKKTCAMWEINYSDVSADRNFQRLLIIPCETNTATSGKIIINDGMTDAVARTLNTDDFNKAMGLPAAPLAVTPVKLKNIKL